MTIFRESTAPSSDGRTSLYLAEWTPESPVRAVLQIAHGVAEYINRYDGLARFLNEQGIAVLGNDHLGHGQSAGGKPTLFFAKKDGWDRVVDDLYTVHTVAQERYPGVPCFLLGHSMGSFLTRTYLIRYPGSVSGAIVMGTGQMRPALIAAGRLVAGAEMRKVGREGFSPLVDKLAFGAYNKPFAPNRTAFDWLSADTENVDRYVADPLCGGKASVGLFDDMLSGIAFIERPGNLRRMDPHTPVLFISGWEDPVGDRGQGVIAACESFRQAGVQDLELQLYPHMRHEILHETDCRQVFDFLLAWLGKHI